MNTEKKIGKIKSVKVGFGGYQDAMFGVSFQLGSDKGRWDVGDFRGAWGPHIKVEEYTKWTEEDRSKGYADTMRFLADLITTAKVNTVDGLVGIPVEVEFDGNLRKSWRILEEAI